jgi:carbonic anhydrase
MFSYITASQRWSLHTDDISAASVIECAVTHVKISKVVCGHTRYGRAMASLTNDDLGGNLNEWLQPW